MRRANGASEHLAVRLELMTSLRRMLGDRGLRQREAAKLLGVTQPRVSDIVCGKVDRFSIDTLVDMLVALGGRVEVRVATHRNGRR